MKKSQRRPQSTRAPDDGGIATETRNKNSNAVGEKVG